MVAQLHTAHHAAGLRLQCRVAKRHILRAAAFSGDAVHPLLVVKLPHQLDHQVALFCKGPVCALQHVAAQFAARFLQGRNGAGRRQAAGGSALAHVPVATDLLQFAHPVIPVGDQVALQPAHLQRPEGVIRQPSHHMHDVPAKVCQLFLVHACRVAQHIPLLRGQLHVLVHGVVHLVNGGLGVLHHVDVPKARRAVLFPEQRVEHKGVFPVIVKAPVPHGRVVLAGIQHHAVAVFAVVQHRLSAGQGLFVVPVHHHALVAGVQAVVVDVLCHVQAVAGVSLELWVLAFQLVVVGQAQAEQVRAVLHVLHARLPVQHQDVDALDADLAQSAPRRRVPEHALHAGSGLELAPPGVAVGRLVVALLQHRGQDLRQHLGGRLVVRCARQHVRLRVVVHGIGVLVGNAVEQPPAGRLRLAFHHLVLVVLPVSHPEPQLVFDDAFVQRGLARLVLLQQVVCLPHLVLTDCFRFVRGFLRPCRKQLHAHRHLRRLSALHHPVRHLLAALFLWWVSLRQLSQQLFLVHRHCLKSSSPLWGSCARPCPAGHPSASARSRSCAG